MTDVRREISNYLARRFDLHYDYDNQILVTVGGSEGIDCAIRCLINPGDEVLIPEPSFVCYGPMVSLASGVPVPIQLSADNEFRLSPEQLLSVVTDKTKVLVLPIRPIPPAALWSWRIYKSWCPFSKKRALWFCPNEIYAELHTGRSTSPWRTFRRCTARPSWSTA